MELLDGIVHQKLVDGLDLVKSQIRSLRLDDPDVRYLGELGH